MRLRGEYGAHKQLRTRTDLASQIALERHKVGAKTSTNPSTDNNDHGFKGILSKATVKLDRKTIIKRGKYTL